MGFFPEFRFPPHEQIFQLFLISFTQFKFKFIIPTIEAHLYVNDFSILTPLQFGNSNEQLNKYVLTKVSWIIISLTLLLILSYVLDSMRGLFAGVKEVSIIVSIHRQVYQIISELNLHFTIKSYIK